MGHNGAGRFRVLLKAEDKQDHQDWAAQGLVAVAKWHDRSADRWPHSSGSAVADLSRHMD